MITFKIEFHFIPYRPFGFYYTQCFADGTVRVRVLLGSGLGLELMARFGVELRGRSQLGFRARVQNWTTAQ